MSDAGKPSGITTPRWLFAVLLLSLMANMLFVGLAAGRMWAHSHGHGWQSHRRGDRFGAFLNALPVARRQELDALLHPNRDAMRQGREELRRLRGEIQAAITKEPFDRSELEAAIARVGAFRQSLRDKATRELVEAVAKMTAEERKVFVDKGFGPRGRRKGDVDM